MSVIDELTSRVPSQPSKPEVIGLLVKALNLCPSKYVDLAVAKHYSEDISSNVAITELIADVEDNKCDKNKLFNVFEDFRSAVYLILTDK